MSPPGGSEGSCGACGSCAPLEQLSSSDSGPRSSPSRRSVDERSPLPTPRPSVLNKEMDDFGAKIGAADAWNEAATGANAEAQKYHPTCRKPAVRRALCGELIKWAPLPGFDQQGKPAGMATQCAPARCLPPSTRCLPPLSAAPLPLAAHGRRWAPAAPRAAARGPLLTLLPPALLTTPPPAARAGWSNASRRPRRRRRRRGRAARSSSGGAASSGRAGSRMSRWRSSPSAATPYAQLRLQNPRPAAHRGW